MKHRESPPSGRSGILWFRNTLDGGVLTITPGQHAFIAGVTGSGKSRLIRQLARNMIPAIADGYISLNGIDLKDGVEFEPWSPWMARMADSLDSATGLLESVDEQRQERNQALRAQGMSKVRISRETPLIVILIDELGELSGGIGRDTRQKQEKIQWLLDRILRLGRSAGITVVAATQDPRKEASPLRDRFPNRFALALNSKAETVMMMGEAALHDGCAPHTIPLSKPGTGYWHDQQHHRAIRFRTIN
jgi:S-DNA-T family DNA segregation ATPase FtsK/SpoIIIE